MNTFLPKNSWTMSVVRSKQANLSVHWHFYIYFFALLIFYAIMYSLYGSSDTVVASTESTPATPIPLVDPSLGSLIGVFIGAAPAWGTTLIGIAKNLFYILATIEIIWTAIRLTLRQADLMEWTSELVYQILFIGFFLALLTNSANWSYTIIQSFNQAGQIASVAGGGLPGLSPTNIFTTGYEIANKLLNTLPFIQVGDAIFLVLSALIILICSALIAAFMILALIETYLAVYGGIIFLGFGGSRFTSQIAIKTLMYTFATGAKLFFIQLLGGLTETQLVLLQKEFTGFTTVSNTIIFKIIGVLIILLIIIKRAPEILQSMLNGINFNFNFAASTASSGASDIPQTPAPPSTIITELKASLEMPSGFIPLSAGMFNTGPDSIANDSLGSRLTDIQNTYLYASTLNESSNVNPESPPFVWAIRAVPTSSSGNNAMLVTSNIVTPGNVGTSADTRTSPATTAGNISGRTSENVAGTIPGSTQAPASNQAGATTNQSGQPTASAIPGATILPDQNPFSASKPGSIQQPATEYQPSGLGGHFGSDPQTATSFADMPAISGQPGPLGQGSQSIPGLIVPSGGQSPTDLVTNIPNTLDQLDQGTAQEATSPALSQNAQTQADQQFNNMSASEKASVAAVAGQSQNMGGKLSSDLTNTGSGAGAQPGSTSQTSQIPAASSPAVAAPSTSFVPTSAAPASSASASTAPATSSTPASSAPTSSAPTSSAPASTAPATSATPASSAPTSSAPVSSAPPTSSVPTSSAPASTAPATSATPASSAPTSSAPVSSTPPTSSVPTSSAPASTAPTTSATPASSVPTSSAPVSSTPPTSSAPDSKAPVSSTTDSNKNPDGQKSASDDKKSDSKSADDSKNPADKKPGDDDKKADTTDKDKTNDQEKQGNGQKNIPDDDQKKKPKDSDKNDDSYADKPKKPHNPKDDHHDKK